MLFFPYRADLEHWRLPLVTILICALCMLVFAHQNARKLELDVSIIHYCNTHNNKEFQLSLGHLAAVNQFDVDSLCMHMLRSSHNSDDPAGLIRQWAFYSQRPLGSQETPTRAYINDVFQRHYDRFSIDAPTALTHKLWFSPDDLSVIRMVTSVFAHNSLTHLAGNLFFFFAFAAAVELVIGGLSLAASVVLLAIVTNLFYAFISLMQGAAVPTLGLSGIVFGMMTMFVYLLPQANVKCLLWFFVVFSRFAIPAWCIVLAFVGWNLYDWLSYGIDSDVNFIVHIAGAAFGYLISVSVFRISKRRYHAAVTVRSVQRKFGLPSAGSG